MKRFASIIVLLFAAVIIRAQTAPEGYQYVDSLVFTRLSDVDSTLAGRNIFSVMPDGVTVNQASAVRNAVEMRSRSASHQTVAGYRIRIFFDNSQTARGASEAALYRFKVKNPGVSAYRSFTSPYFKVTVGDYRNKSEALAALKDIKKDFPTAFIVRERFRYPSLGKTSAYKVDTLKILKPIR
jgi:hypothetical protein